MIRPGTGPYGKLPLGCHGSASSVYSIPIKLSSAVWDPGGKLTGSTSNWGVSKSSSLIMTGRPDSDIRELETESEGVIADPYTWNHNCH